VPPCPVSDGLPAAPDVDDELPADEADIDLDDELDAWPQLRFRPDVTAGSGNGFR
jgi:hypothetical protein